MRKKYIFKIKICHLCQKEYVPTSGTQKVCKNCKKKRVRNYQTLWTNNNKKKVLKNSHQYRIRNLEKVRARDRIYKQKEDKEKRRKRDRLLYLKNKERYREKARRWKKNNLNKAS